MLCPVITPPSIIHQCFRHCWEVLAHCQSFFCFPLCPLREEVEAELGLGGDTARTTYPDWPMSYSLSCHTQKSSIKEKRKERWWLWFFYLPRLALWMPRPCLPGGVWAFASWWKVLSEFLPCFALLCMYRFYFIYKLSFPWFISCLAIHKHSAYPTRQEKE